MKPELEQGISQLKYASFKAFQLRQPAFLSYWHYHPELELIYFACGKGMRFIGDDISIYQEGDIYLIGERLPHTFVSFQEEAIPTVEAFCIQFPKNLFETFVECHPLQNLFLEAEKGIAFQQVAPSLILQFRHTVLSNDIEALISLMTLLDGLNRNSSRSTILAHSEPRFAAISEPDTRIRTAIDFINTHYHRSIALHEIAGACHLSPNAFCRWFKQHLGVTFVVYLNKVRLTHVCQLLLSTNLPVGQIAQQTGFDNISTLNRLFQQKINTSPRRYRKQFK